METTEEFLAHYGVKGMKWGVRKKRSSGESDEPKTKMSTKKKVAIGGAAAILLAGGTAVAVMLKKNGAKPIKNIGPVTTSEEHKRFIKELSRKQLSLVNAANEDLKRGYNDLDIPFPKRGYLDPMPWKKKIMTTRI